MILTQLTSRLANVTRVREAAGKRSTLTDSFLLRMLLPEPKKAKKSQQQTGDGGFTGEEKL